MIKVLETARLRLRALERSDASAIFALRSNEEVNKYLDRNPPKEIAEAKAFIEKIANSVKDDESYYWAITLKDDPALIGTICIWNLSDDKRTGELGYELLPTMQGKGIMQEAMKSVISFAAKDLGMKRLEAYSHKENLSSTKLLLKYNFILEPNKIDEHNASNVIYFLLPLPPDRNRDH